MTNKKGKGIVSTLKAFVCGRSQLPPSVRKVLKDFGNVEISHITLARNPLSAAVKLGMNAISLGDFEKKAKKLPYDRLFHLFAVIALKNNKQIRLEKNEVIQMKVGKGTRKNSEVKLVNINKKITLNTLMENTKKYMGSKFLPYSGVDNNCQDFLTAVMKANQLGDESHIKFIKQNTSSIFKKNPIFAKLTNLVTDIGARINVLQEGAGTKQRKPRIKKATVKKIAKLSKARRKKILKERREKRKLEESFRPLINAIENLKFKEIR